MNPIRDEARKIAEQDRAALTATMTDIERETLLRKLQRRVRHNLRELRDTQIRNLYRDHDILLNEYAAAIRAVTKEHVPEPIRHS
jgi:hypothetical protein